MKTTLELPDELLIEAKKRAAELRKPLRALIEDGLRMVLQQTHLETPKKEIQFVTVKGGLAPNLDISNREAMYAWIQKNK